MRAECVRTSARGYQLSAHPEAQPRYPGSQVVKLVGSNETATRDTEPDPAYAGAILRRA
jgi:hypothetical protein